MNESEFTALAERARSGHFPSPPPTAEILGSVHRRRTRRRASWIAGLLGLLIITGVGVLRWSVPSDDGRPDVTDDQTLPFSGSWKLDEGTVSGRTLEVQADYPVTLTVERRDGGLYVGGQSACNSYGAKVSVEENAITIGSAGSTAMACADPVLELEAAYQQSLSEVTRFRQTDDRLTLSGPTVDLHFIPLPAIPTADLVDTEWQLETITDGDVSSSVVGKPSLQLRSDGTFKMTAGCGLVLTGDWTERHGTVTFTSSSASGGCQQHPQSQAILEASDSFYVEVDGDQLTVTGRHGGQLVYRANPAAR